MFNSIFEGKLSVNAILALAFRVIKQNKKTFVIISLLMNIPICSIYFFMFYYLGNNTLFISLLRSPDEMVNMLNNGLLNKEAEQIFRYLGVMLLVNYIFVPVCKMVMAVFTDSVIKGKPLGFEAIIVYAASKLRFLLTASFIHFTLIAVTMVFIVPPILFYIFLIFTPYIIALRQTGGAAALKYSYKLVKGQFAVTLSYMLMFFLFNYGISRIFTIMLPLPDFLNMIFVSFIDSFFCIVYTIWFIHLDFFKTKGGDTKASSVS